MRSDDGELERWPDFFTEDCLYKVMPRENFERELPIALIYCESRNMLADRVVALRETALYVPRIVRHLTGNIRLRAIEPQGLRLTANFALFQSMVDQPSELFLCGRYHDRSSKTAADCALPRDLRLRFRRSFRPRSSTRCRKKGGPDMVQDRFPKAIMPLLPI